MKEFLEEWQTRGVFAHVVDVENRKCGSVRFWGARQKWLREANLTSSVATAVRAKRVRLACDINGGPDSEMELRDGSLIRFQHVEADLDGRRRGDEYRDWAKSKFAPRADPSDAWEKRRDEFPFAIERVVKKKVERKQAGKYDDTVGLLIYVNIGTYGTWRKELERELVERSRPAGECFRSVWAWWSGRLYRCWPSPSIGPPDAWRPEPTVLGWSKHHTPLSEILI